MACDVTACQVGPAKDLQKDAAEAKKDDRLYGR